jgi:outer membrane protein assembly factor BamB
MSMANSMTFAPARLLLTASFALAVLTACYAPLSSESHNASHVGFTLAPQSVGDTVESYELRVLAPDLRTRELRFDGNVDTFSLTIPAGDGRVFDLLAITNVAEPVYRGSVTLDLRPGEQAKAKLEMSQGWTVSAGSGFRYTSPAIGPDGTVYAQSFNDLFAFNPDGTVRWSRNTGHSSSLFMRPAVGPDGTVYVGSNSQTEVRAYSPGGSLKWTFDTAPDPVQSGVAVDADGTVYALTTGSNADAALYAIRPNGTEKWSTAIGDLGRAAPSIGPDGTVYVAVEPPAANASLFAVRPNGTVKWEYPGLTSGFGASAVSDDGVVYVTGGFGQNVHAVDAQSGTQKWVYDTGENPIAPPAIAPDGTIYVTLESGSFNAGLLALNPNGTEKWFFLSGGGADVGGAVVGADGTVYFQDGGALTVHAINPNGSEKWGFSMSAIGEGVPAIDSRGRLFQGDGNSLYMINTESYGIAGGPWPRAGGQDAANSANATE